MRSNARQISLLSPAVGTGNVGDHFIEAAVRRMLREDVVYRCFSIRKPLSASDLDQVNRTSCALICGTNLYQHDWESALTPSMLDRITVPVIPFGVGSSAASLDETLVSEQTRTMIRAIHERCILGSVRDGHAARVVERAGVKNFVVTGCPVLFWAGAGELPPISARPRQRLVLTARNWLMHRWPDNVDHPVQIELLRRIFRRFAPSRPIFAVHEDFDRRLIDLLQVPADSLVDASDPRRYVELYSDPDNVVLALRLHAGMLARANGVPAIFVGHDTRTYAFCDLLGIECIDLFAPNSTDRCIQLINAAMRSDPAFEPRAGEVFARLGDSMHRFLAANELPFKDFTERSAA